ncbi:DESI1 [Symbiodinium pilosum]|uniref:DESI1 protein n=1 Tax=Symbiodinium pilosum TaxID=2952 RepID=A0A812XUC5_SYMPI|nr:DESI1 [Symbiodinium pilosum]
MAAGSRPVLVLGATGGIGLHLVKQLLAKGTPVRAVLRSPDKLPDETKQDANISLVQIPGVTDLTDEDLDTHVRGCAAVVSCLGHVGVYDEPRDLVLQTTRRVCQALGRTHDDESQKSKFVLLNTVLVTNPNDPNDSAQHGWASRMLVSALHWALPPMVDNTKTAHYLIEDIGQEHPKIEYCIVRPDSLSDTHPVSDYLVHETLQNGVFSPIGTSKANVANLMMRLVLEQPLWEMWRCKMPVVVDKKG